MNKNLLFILFFFVIVVFTCLVQGQVTQKSFIAIWNTDNTSTGSTTDNETITMPNIGNNYNTSWTELHPGTKSTQTTGRESIALTFHETDIYQTFITQDNGVPIDESIISSTSIDDDLPGAFITKWDTRLTSSTGTDSSANATIVFGSQGTNYTISYSEIGGSGYSETLTEQGNNPTVTFPEPGVYTVKMSGLTGYTSSNNYIKGLIAIEQWGTTHWTNLYEGFFNASRMDVTATDTPDLSGITSLYGLFYGNNALTNTNGSISGWNTSTITNMGFLFREAYVFNQPLDSWDVSNVTNISQIFCRAYAFNQPLDSWVTSNVTDMNSAFFEASSFNQQLNSWDVSNVYNMSKMFYYDTSFNQTLETWDLTKVTNITNMLYHSGLDCPHYSSTLQGWSKNSNTPSNLTLSSASPLHYGVSAQAAHNTLTSSKGWAIEGDTYDGTCPGADVITGIVWDDANGDGTIQSSETGTSQASSWIYLVDSTHTIVDSSAVQSSGNYAFYNYTSGMTYNIILNKTQYAKGDTLGSSLLDTGWVNVSYNNSTATTNKTGINDVEGPVANGSTIANVGVEQSPTATAVSKTVASPQMFNLVDVVGYRGIASSDSNAAPLAGTDPEDGSKGTGSTFYVGAIDLTTQLYYNGTQLSDGTTIIDYNPSLLSIYALTTSNGPTFTYAVVDNAGVLSDLVNYSLQSTYVLPVTLSSFNATAVNGAVHLEWSTSSEINTRSFTIQRSSDNGTSWLTIGSQVAAGNSSLLLNYSYIDTTSLSGNLLYRLLETDIDGTQTYSNVVSVNISSKTSNIILYPNPANSTITLANISVGANIRILDMDGRVYKTVIATNTNQQIDVSNLAPGIYLVYVTSTNSTNKYSFKLFKK